MIQVNNEINELIKKIKNLGWTVEKEENNDYRLGKFSPVGQDFSISIEGKVQKICIDSIYFAYENYDVSEETYLWLDNTGHGKKGAPYHMRDVLEDMEACEQMILDLYDELNK